MCLIISIIFFVGAYHFYENSLYFQSLFSLFLAVGILLFFLYRIIKNRRCFFGNARDCNKKE